MEHRPLESNAARSTQRGVSPGVHHHQVQVNTTTVPQKQCAIHRLAHPSVNPSTLTGSTQDLECQSTHQRTDTFLNMRDLCRPWATLQQGHPLLHFLLVPVIVPRPLKNHLHTLRN